MLRWNIDLRILLSPINIPSIVRNGCSMSLMISRALLLVKFTKYPPIAYQFEEKKLSAMSNLRNGHGVSTLNINVNSIWVIKALIGDGELFLVFWKGLFRSRNFYSAGSRLIHFLLSGRYSLPPPRSRLFSYLYN